MDFKKLNQTITEIEQQLDLSVSSDDLMDAEFDGYYAIHLRNVTNFASQVNWYLIKFQTLMKLLQLQYHSSNQVWLQLLQH